MPADTGGPGLVVRANSGIEVAKEKKVIRLGYTTNQRIEFAIELVFFVFWRTQSWRIHAKDSDNARNCAKAQLQSALCAP